MTLLEIQEHLKLLRSIDTRDHDLHFVQKQLGKLPLPIPITILKEGHYVVRARYIASDFPSQKKEVSYPYEPAFVKGFGRCNFPSQQIFYGAVMSDQIPEPRVTGISEIVDLDTLDRQQRNFIAISIWRVQEDVFLAELYLSDRHIRNEITRRANDFHKAVLSGLDRSQREKYEEILSYFGDELASPVGRYMLTSSISNLYLNKLIDVDGTDKIRIEGLSYPSIKTQARGMNVALIPQSADNKLKLESVVIQEIIFAGPKDVYLNDFEMSSQISDDGNKILGYTKFDKQKLQLK